VLVCREDLVVVAMKDSSTQGKDGRVGKEYALGNMQIQAAVEGGRGWDVLI
jgi:hypothetical protein